MNASRARRRWLRWCRYVQKTGTVTQHRPVWSPTPFHAGQVKAWGNYTYAKRYPPRGVRYVHLPSWGTP